MIQEIFSAILSSSGGARKILQLAEAGFVKAVVSSMIVAELEGVLRKKALSALPYLALLLDRIRCEIVPDPPIEEIKKYQAFIDYLFLRITFCLCCYLKGGFLCNS